MYDKKLILVLEPDRERLGVLMFTISTAGFKVVGCHTQLEADAIAKEKAPDAIFVESESHYKLRHIPTVLRGKRTMYQALAALRIARAQFR
jgi:hypothetical protein